MKYIRFDDKSDRTQRVKTDKFCMIRKLWTKFIENFQACYNPSQHLTVDEQLLPSKNRCSFIQYMPNKPDKFGIKSWMLPEVESKYTLNGFPYLGKDCDSPNNKLQGEYVVETLIEPYKNKGYCVSCDNYFTTLRLAENLLKQKTTLVGVDSVDYMTRLYSVKCKTRRWPLQVFFNILNLAGINSWVLFKKCNNYTLSRRFFLIGHAEEILKFINESRNPITPTTPLTPSASRKRLGSVENSPTPKRTDSRKKCQIRSSNENKSSFSCNFCTRVACKSCLEEKEIIQKAICKCCFQEGKRI
ncbi:unnamed protein product [Brachionus calyciflorus]|uniref:PiggyBac transposable element-derived protein domain-containing protein n=1 Tax=Brachionus calyciflorus TaxID=104777 RepID=A0A814B0W6_9BILA|nr:unnamed protein product [Brachionus calyciflorus]